MTEPLFDTHAHLISDDWEKYPPRPLRPDMPTPQRTPYTVTAEMLVQWMDEHHVPSACVVQRGHVYGYDNSYILDAARRYPDRLLPVVILDTQHPETPAQLTDLVKYHGVRGLRMANTRPEHLDTAWMSSPAAMRVWRTCADLGLPVTIIVFLNQLPYVLPLLHVIVRMFPGLPIVVDHLGTPYGATLVELAWARAAGISEAPLPPPPDYGIESTIGIFADTPDVVFKLTEVNLERLVGTGISAARLVRRVADTFGAERVLWGSDVGQSLRWSYAEKATMARAAADHLEPRERALFVHDNAARIYATPVHQGGTQP